MKISEKRPLKQLLRICPICNNDRGENLHTQRFKLYEGHCLPDEYDVVACDKCGFVFADTPAKQCDYNEFYSELSKYEFDIAIGGRVRPYEIERYERIVRDASKYLANKRSSILDIGCANGGLLHTFKLHGYNNLVGLDPSASCVKQVQAQGIDAYKGGLYDDNFDGLKLEKKFDCVILSHVLEHVYDLNKALDNLVAYVKKDGLLYIEVPDASRYTRYYITPFHYFEWEHINHFDEHSVDNLLKKHPFEKIVSAKKDLQHSDIEFYPAVYSIYKRVEMKNVRSEVAPHYEVRENVIRYIEMSRNADFWPELDALSKSHEQIVIWGAGAYALRLYKTSMLKECNIKCFVDRDPKKQSKSFDNKVTIQSPETGLKDFLGTIVVCSAVYNFEIVKDIAKMGLRNNVIVLK